MSNVFYVLKVCGHTRSFEVIWGQISTIGINNFEHIQSLNLIIKIYNVFYNSIFSEINYYAISIKKFHKCRIFAVEFYVDIFDVKTKFFQKKFGLEIFVFDENKRFHFWSFEINSLNDNRDLRFKIEILDYFQSYFAGMITMNKNFAVLVKDL